mgnify:CR=1 FL=1
MLKKALLHLVKNIKISLVSYTYKDAKKIEM